MEERRERGEREGRDVAVTVVYGATVHGGPVCTEVQWLPATRCSGVTGLCVGRAT